MPRSMPIAGPTINRSSVMNPGAFRLGLATVVVFDHFYGVVLGRTAVLIFFVLSGYWITRMWSERYVNTVQPYVTYMVSRLWRLAPIMLLATLVSALVAFVMGASGLLGPQGGNPAHWIFSHLFFIGYLSLPEPRLLPPAWSLDIEMRFYLIAPALIMVMNRFGVLKFALLALLLTGVSRALPGSGLQYLVVFAIGMVAAKTEWKPSRSFATGSLAALVVALLALNLAGYSDLLFDRSKDGPVIVMSWTLALLAVPYAIATCDAPSDARDRKFGDLSYAVYLIHWPLCVMAYSMTNVTFASTLPFVAMTFGLGFVALALVDRPVQSWRARWLSSQEKPAPVTASVQRVS